MRKNTIFGAVALGVTGIFLTGGIANATVGPTLSLSKSKVVAGDQITVTGTCEYDSWDKTSLVSDALAGGTVTWAEKGKSPKVTGFGQVKKDVKPGTYAVSFKCGDNSAKAQLTVVVPAPPKPTTSTKPPVSTKPKPGQVAVKPKGPADTGAGGAVEESDAGWYALGGAGLLAAGGAGAFFLRRRPRV